MRVLTVLVALMATPVLTAVSQDRGHQAATWVSENGLCATADENRSPSSLENNGQPDDKKGRDRRGCSPTPACGISPALSLGTQTINGRVLLGDPLAGLSGPLIGLPCWGVQLRRTILGENVTIATAVTDDLGNYSFTELTDGIYTVCEVLPQSGWQETFPTSRFGVLCSTDPTVFGWRVTLRMGGSAFTQNFFNLPQ